MPLSVTRDQAHHLAARPRWRAIRAFPITTEKSTHQFHRIGSGKRGAGRTAVITHGSALSNRETKVRSFAAAHCAVVTRWRPPSDGQGAKHVRGQDQSRVVPAMRKRVESSDQQKILLVGSIISIARKLICGLDDDRGTRVQLVIRCE